MVEKRPAIVACSSDLLHRACVVIIGLATIFIDLGFGIKSSQIAHFFEVKADFLEKTCSNLEMFDRVVNRRIARRPALVGTAHRFQRCAQPQSATEGVHRSLHVGSSTEAIIGVAHMLYTV